MSVYKRAATIDSYNFGEFIKDPLGALQQMFQAFFNPDEFDGVDTFRAVIISNPVSISLGEYKALGYEGGSNRMEQDFKKFKVRITHKSANPHALLADPCDINFAQDKCEQNALVAVHTTIATPNKDGLNIGAYIAVKLSKNPNGTFNLQTGEFVRLINRNETGITTLSGELCESVKKYFTYGESFIAPPVIELTSTIRELAERYDREAIPGKTTPVFAGRQPHNTYVSGKGDNSVKSLFIPWVKAFIVIAHDLGLKVQITSGFRSQEQQEQLHREYQARKRANPNDPSKWGLPAACGTCSRHRFGFAIDVNLIDRNNNVITSRSPNPVWVATGLIGVVTQAPFYLKWGGMFKQRDAIHFEFNPPEWGDNMDAILDMNPDGNYDTVNTGYTSSEVQELTNLALQAELGAVELDEEIPPEVLAAGSADMPTEAELVAQQEAEEEAEERDRRNDAIGDAFSGI